ncbi:MAG: YdbL family protein [Novosphingobium sp.]
MTASFVSGSRRLAASLAFAALAFGTSSAALAQRDPAYASARVAGQVGEKTDGYLGYPSPPSPSLRSMVEDLNIKRRAVYSEKAQAAGATIEEYAFTSGCRLISQTAPGEKYEGPSGGWLTRSSAPPQRDARCP